MGTRHLICVVDNGEYKVAQYGQWDGYPSGQGVSILDFLRNGNVPALRENLAKCSWISKKEKRKMWAEFGVAEDAKTVPCDVYDKFGKKYPQFNRDTGADILALIANAPYGMKLQSDLDFAKDSLFCEWAYVIDFDKNALEVYNGFNNLPLENTERFYSEDLVKYNDTEQYFPIKFLASFDLSNLPSDEEFVKTCEPSEDEEEIPAF